MRLALSLLVFFFSFSEAKPLFQITLDPAIAPKGASGRLFVLMAKGVKGRSRISTSFTPGATWFAAMELEHIAPGQTVSFDPDLKAYPKPFSEAPAGEWEFMALLDPNHSFAVGGQDAGDFQSTVVGVKDWDPATAQPVALTLSSITPPRSQPKETEGIELVEFQSPMLTAFWGRPIMMQAGVVLPPDYGKRPKTRYPTVYRVHGFGGNHRAAWNQGNNIRKQMSEGKYAEMVHVFLNASFPSGHHVFADSVNNGPWGAALTTEFIPFLEKKYKLMPKPGARFLTGHSSGGWSTLWLQVAYPDFFGGTWPTAPDPVDFRSFTGIDATPGSAQLAFQKLDGKPVWLVRANGKDVATFEEFLRQEEVAGPVGGQLASFEWVFSPKGPDGRPMQLFNRVTGVQDSVVQEYWKRYDIRRIVEENWAQLGPKLLGKIRLVVGSQDTFHLDEAATMLCGFLKSKGREDACEIVPGRDHGDLYQPYETYKDGLALRIDQEMKKQFERYFPPKRR